MATVGLTVRRFVRGLCAAVALLVLVVGLPWALAHFVGWPLPRHLPTAAEVSGLLLAPLSTQFLLDLLAVACWIAWAFFAVDIVRCAVTAGHELHLPDWSARRGPLHGVAALLVGAILLPLLTSRAAPAAPSPSLATTLTRPVASTSVVVDTTHGTVAPSLGSRSSVDPAHLTVVVRAPDPRTGVHDSLWRIAARELGDGLRWPEIFALNHGAPLPYGGTFNRPSLVYPGQHLRLPTPTAPDRSAPTHPGDPSTPDPDRASGGRPAASPSPTPAPAPTASTPTVTPSPATPQPAAPPYAAPPTTAATAPTTHSASTDPTTPTTPTPWSTGSPSNWPVRPSGVPAAASAPPKSPGIAVGPETFVGFGLAAAVSAALVVARRRHRRGYRPGSGRRDDLPVAPAVYSLRLAHLRRDAPDDTDDTDDPDGPEGPDDDRDPSDGSGGSSPAGDLVRVENGAGPEAAPVRPAGPAPGSAPTAPVSAPARFSHIPVAEPAATPAALILGVRDGQETALDLAAVHGLGLVGYGATAAARAALTTLLTTGPATDIDSSVDATRAEDAAPVRVVIPAADLAALLGPPPSPRPALPVGLCVTATLDDALDLVEATIVTHAARPPRSAAEQAPVLTLITAVPTGSTARLQSVLDNAAPYGITGLILGPWPAGATAHVRVDGVVSATDPGPGRVLRGTRLFVMGAGDAVAVLDLVSHARPVVADAAPPADHAPDLGSSPDPAPFRPVPTPRPRLATAGSSPPDGSADASVLSPEDTQTEAARSPTPPPAAATTPGPTRRARPAPPDVPVELEVTAEDAEDAENGQEQAVVAAEPQPVERVHRAVAPASGPEPHQRPGLRIVIFGPVRVYWRSADTGEATDAASHQAGPDHDEVEVTGAFPPQVRQLLVFLAVHPDGAPRQALIAALWPDSTAAQATNSVNTTLSRLRRALRSATGGAVDTVVLPGHGTYRLDPTVVDIDYTAFARAHALRRAVHSGEARQTALQAMIDTYAGPLAEGLSAEWIEPVREALRRDALDAVAARARALAVTDPEATLELLETARTSDPHNELLYRDIMRLQSRLGHWDSIERTLALLTTRLAELGEQPSSAAVDLAARLRRRADAGGDTDQEAEGVGRQAS